jgi:gentisate 1,2-dioxygenase
MAFDQVQDLASLNTVLDGLTMRAGWNKKEPSLWPEPRTAFLPARWQWRDARRGLFIASGMISTDLADRRNLFMVNPTEGNHYATLRTLVSAYQMIRPGETARSHRHSPHALRLVLETTSGAYTVVNGERLDMAENDVVLTPGGYWHGHGNDGADDAYWIDFLDVPMVQLLEPMFLEHFPGGFQLPESANVSTELVFRWSDIQPDLAARLAAAGMVGTATRVLDAPSMPTTELSMTALGAGIRSPLTQSTDNQIMAVVTGTGTSTIGDHIFTWSRGDVIAVPAWTPHRHHASADSVLFRVSDALAQKKLGYYRSIEHEAAGAANLEFTA